MLAGRDGIEGMNQQTTQLLHCDACGAMQPNRPTCRVCGARLTGYVDPSDGGMVLAPGVARDVAVAVIVLLGGVVVVGAVVLLLLFALL